MTTEIVDKIAVFEVKVYPDQDQIEPLPRKRGAVKMMVLVAL